LILGRGGGGGAGGSGGLLTNAGIIVDFLEETLTARDSVWADAPEHGR